ncbi:MAG: exosortase-associated EpsI family protein [Chloroflexota bacterium]|nr:exosortase-associated EpsI family protein [Chloroflexota bacterium]
MKRVPWRYAALIVVVILVGAGTLLLSVRTAPPLPTPDAAATVEPMYSYLIDVAGWYEITPNERAVSSPIDLSIEGLKALPATVGNWSGAPYDIGIAPEVWFENPDLALSNFYRDTRGHQLWFSTFGSRGTKSYFLFEHTPITSYPAAGWTLIENGVAPFSIGSSRIYVQKATLSKDNERRVVLYWYLWSDFDRDPAKGVLTVRLHIPVVTTDQDAVEAGADFLRALFPQVLPWHRF